jgi:hypothetical protein
LGKEKKFNKIKIRAFRAIDEHDTCERFLEGHSDVLKAYGVKKVTSASTDWFYNPYSYVMIAECQRTGEMVAGIRVHLAKGDHPLPFVDAIFSKDEKVNDFVDSVASKGTTGEICGLWNSRSAKGMGISFLLMKVSCSILNQVKADSLLGLCSPFTLPMLQEVGYVVDQTLGNNGTFYYPKEDLIATTIMLRDTVRFEDANPVSKRNILEIRRKNKQSRLEFGPKGELIVDYNLLMNQPLREISTLYSEQISDAFAV